MYGHNDGFYCRDSHARDGGLGFLQRIDTNCQSWRIPSCDLSRATCQTERQTLFAVLMLERLMSQQKVVRGSPPDFDLPLSAAGNLSLTCKLLWEQRRNYCDHHCQQCWHLCTG